MLPTSLEIMFIYYIYSIIYIILNCSIVKSGSSRMYNVELMAWVANALMMSFTGLRQTLPDLLTFALALVHKAALAWGLLVC